MRVPTINVSLVDLTLKQANTTAAEVNDIIKRQQMGDEGVLSYNDEQLVSVFQSIHLCILILLHQVIAIW